MSYEQVTRTAFVEAVATINRAEAEMRARIARGDHVIQTIIERLRRSPQRSVTETVEGLIEWHASGVMQGYLDGAGPFMAKGKGKGEAIEFGQGFRAGLEAAAARVREGKQVPDEQDEGRSTVTADFDGGDEAAEAILAIEVPPR